MRRDLPRANLRLTGRTCLLEPTDRTFNQLTNKAHTMKKVQIFDPALCCSSGVCGTDVDQNLVDFSANVDWAKQQGLNIERLNLAQQPMAFAENAAVKGLLERSGEAALPITLVDGEVAFAGRYPSRDDLARWIGTAATVTEPASDAASSSCCSGGKCC
jgi:hypothetical protein